ncbi:MAG: heavy-metal-associated domain-containing protein [Candidatus Bathyarchaeia archaeon]
MIDDSRTTKVMLTICNTRCSYCSRVIEQKLKSMQGIVDISVSYLTDKVLVRYNPTQTNTQVIRESIKKLGYETVERR